MHKPEPVKEKKIHKILSDFVIETISNPWSENEM